MSLNVQTFKTRTLTAIVFAVVMLFALFGGGIPFILVFSIVMAGCLWEFMMLFSKINGRKRELAIPYGFIYIVVPLVLYISMGFWDVDHEKTHPLFQFSLQNYWPLIPCAILFSLWINDTMAYIVGSFIGKTPFSPISPKKTWEGTIGGALICVAVMTALSFVVPAAQVLPWYHWAVVFMLCAVFGTLGDLLESKLKRMAGVKDSGRIMPGHGGFLDRFDSLLLATPAVFLYLYFILR